MNHRLSMGTRRSFPPSLLLLDRDPTPEDYEAERDAPRPGVWAGEPGADLRRLTQDETECLIRLETAIIQLALDLSLAEACRKRGATTARRGVI